MFDSKPICNEKYLKTKIKCYKGNLKTDSHDNKILLDRLDFHYVCLTLILIVSVLKDTNYHLFRLM